MFREAAQLGRLVPRLLHLGAVSFSSPDGLRAEVTISKPQDFRVYRRTDDPHSALGWRPLRQSTADMHHRAQVSGAAGNRYCCALATVDDTSTLEELTSLIECRRCWKGPSVRAIHPFPTTTPYSKPYIAASSKSTAFAIVDRQFLLYSTPPKTKTEQRRRSAAISRKLRLLRAHGRIRKRPRSHRYDVTRRGRFILNAILLAHRISVRQITTIAA